MEGSSGLIGRVAKVFDATADIATTGSATIDLRELLPMLNSVSHLPTAVFENLNIQIEFDASTGNQILNDITTTMNTLRPVLAADVIDNPKVVDSLNAKLKNASWLEVEHDFFVIPQSVNNGGVNDQLLLQPTNVQLSNFNNKHLERILIVKEIGNPALELAGGNNVQGYGKYSSISSP